MYIEIFLLYLCFDEYFRNDKVAATFTPFFFFNQKENTCKVIINHCKNIKDTCIIEKCKRVSRATSIEIRIFSNLYPDSLS